MRHHGVSAGSILTTGALSWRRTFNGSPNRRVIRRNDENAVFRLRGGIFITQPSRIVAEPIADNGRCRQA